MSDCDCSFCHNARSIRDNVRHRQGIKIMPRWVERAWRAA